VNNDAEVIGYMVVFPPDPVRWLADWDGDIHATEDDARAEQLHARRSGYKTARVAVLHVLPDTAEGEQ
jgi:hypothetical protein